MPVSNFEIMQLCKYASMQVCKCTSMFMQVYEYGKFRLTTSKGNGKWTPKYAKCIPFSTENRPIVCLFGPMWIEPHWETTAQQRFCYLQIHSQAGF